MSVGQEKPGKKNLLFPSNGLARFTMGVALSHPPVALQLT